MAQGKMLLCFHLFPLAEICVNNSLMYIVLTFIHGVINITYTLKKQYMLYTRINCQKCKKFQILIINIM